MDSSREQGICRGVGGTVPALGMGDVLPPRGEVVKPVCGFCGGHHYVEEPHPGEAVREALAKLTEPPESAIEVGRKTFARERVAESPDAALPSEPEPVTKSVVTKATVTKGRPRIEHPSAEALRRRAYRERRHVA